MKNIKIIILTLSVFGIIIMYALFNTRELGICNFYCGPAINTYQNTFLFFPFIFFFSVVTYKLPQRVFIAWWKFARVAITVIFVLSIMINMGVLHSNGGFFNMDNNFDLAALIFLYSVFTIGSTIQIVRGYRHR